jgi:3-phenylpropionate/cinnamic acid dioxygenase small subunit
MNIQAEISWIKAELTDVEDPNLIEAFKNMLKYRKTKNKLADTFFSTTAEDLKQRAEDSLISIEKGDAKNISEFKRDIQSWKNKQAI